MKGCEQERASDMDWTPDDETANLIRHVAIQNAIEYEGKAAIGSVIGRIMGMRTDLRQHGKIVTGLVAKEVNKANSTAAAEGLDVLKEILEKEAPHLLEKREVKERRTGLPDLKNAEKGKVVLRFAPNPNGPLSFGHARGLVINSTYREMYDGEFILRFDDTDTKVKPPMLDAYERIQKETAWLTGRKPDRVIIASDRMEAYYEHAELMLQNDHGYVCQCSAEVFKEHRIAKTNCPCRDQKTSENLNLWSMMLQRQFNPGDVVVRVKTDMTLKNPALRDWPALRLQDTESHPHPRPEVGSKYVVWPLLDFQSAVEDHLQGVTHIIRGKDLMDSTRKQTLLYEHFGWDYPETMYWGRVKVHEWGGFSTSKMRNDIESGRYPGWGDPRLPTLEGLSGRGISNTALRAFWLELGITQKDISVPLSTLYAHNTKVVDAEAPRLSFIRHPVLCKVESDEIPNSISTPVHPNDESMGMRTWDMIGGEIYIENEDAQKGSLRLKEFADITLKGEPSPVANIDSYERSDKRPIVHWITKENSLEGTLLSTSNDEIQTVQGRIEKHNFAPGTIVQLERIGYACIKEDGSFILCHESFDE
jgi:glutamyl-tRNA synthetase